MHVSSHNDKLDTDEDVAIIKTAAADILYQKLKCVTQHQSLPQANQYGMEKSADAFWRNSQNSAFSLVLQSTINSNALKKVSNRMKLCCQSSGSKFDTGILNRLRKMSASL